MSAVRDVRDLEVWQVAMDLVVACYRVAGGLPPSERFGLSEQMRRAAVSIPSNIAEGYGRRSRGDYIRFLAVANGSLKELETQVLVSSRLGLIRDSDGDNAIALCQRVGSMLTALHRSLSS